MVDMAETKTRCRSHRLPSGLKWAGRGCQHLSVENMPHQQFLALDRIRCVECSSAIGVLCLDCGRVY